MSDELHAYVLEYTRLTFKNQPAKAEIFDAMCWFMAKAYFAFGGNEVNVGWAMRENRVTFNVYDTIKKVTVQGVLTV
jgi:hypothetical protein